jgi:hypothetical protein
MTIPDSDFTVQRTREHKEAMNVRSLLPLGALLVLPFVPTGLEPDPIRADRDLATLMPERTLVYAEAPRLSSLLDRGLRDPLVESLLAGGIDEILKNESGSTAAELLAAGNTLVGLPILETLAQLSAGGAAFGLTARSGKTFALLVLRAEDPTALEDVLDHLFELAPDLSEPSTTYRGTPVWYVSGDLAFGLRDGVLFVANDEDYLRSALELAAQAEARGVASRESFALDRGRGEANLLWAWTDLARVESFAKQGGRGPLAKLRAIATQPAAQLLAGPGLGALGRASVVTAEVSLEREDLRVVLHGLEVDAGVAAMLQPSGVRVAANWPPLASERNVAEAVIYRDLATLFSERVDLFPPRTLPGFAEATSNLALIFGGLDVGEDVFPGLSPWIRLVARPVEFDPEAAPEIPLPAAAAIFEVPDTSLGPRLVSAFQTAIGLINVDRAQKAQDSLLMRLELAGDVEVTWAHFLDPRDGDGTDLRYNLVPACALVGKTFIVGTHRDLVVDLVTSPQTVEELRLASTAETLSVSGADAARVLSDNYEALVMNAVLEEGKTRAKAESDLDGILLLLRMLERLDVEMSYPAEREVSLALELDLRGGAH